jgi:hypothetical protein
LARANSEEADALRVSYAEIVGTPALPDVAAGPGEVAAPPPRQQNPRQASLQLAVDAYRSQTGSVRSGVAFRQFVESAPQHRDALETLDDLLTLFQDAREFGMTGEGIGDFKKETLQEIAPEGISIEALDAAVEAGGLEPNSPIDQ